MAAQNVAHALVARDFLSEAFCLSHSVASSLVGSKDPKPGNSLLVAGSNTAIWTAASPTFSKIASISFFRSSSFSMEILLFLTWLVIVHIDKLQLSVSVRRFWCDLGQYQAK